MTRSVAYIRMYPTDWRTGCLGLSLEQEGLYIRMCMFVAETGRRVPLDDTEAARMMGTQTRNYRRVLGELLRLGKIRRHSDGYGNDRVEMERERATPQERRSNGNVPPNYSRSNDDLTGVADEKPQKNQDPFTEPIPKPRDDVGLSASARDWKTLNEKLTDAAGPILAELASHPGLMNLSVPTMWLNSGADLDLDVLPTLREIAAKRRAAAKVKTWDYFTAAIANAKQRRERGLTPTETTVELLRPKTKPKTEFGAAFDRFMEARA